MKIFLTGSKGFIGSHLLPKLRNLGHDVICDYSRFDKEHWDLVIHLAAVTHIREEFDDAMWDINVSLTYKILSTPYRTIYASSCSARHLTNPYAYTKRYAEMLGEKHGNALGMRFFNVYGPNNNKGIVWFLLQQKDGATIKVRGPELVRDYIFVDDVCDYILLSMDTRYSGIVDVGTGVGTRTIDLVNTFSRISGKKLYIEPEKPGSNEPQEMVADNAIWYIPIETGLLKTIEATK